MQWAQPALRSLRETLAELYPTISDARILVVDAGLRAQAIEFSSKADNNWFNILEYARHGTGRVEAILARALEDSPDNDRLKALASGAIPGTVSGAEHYAWHGADGAQLEKIITNLHSLVSVTYLELGVDRSRSVAKVRLKDGASGTGFLTDCDILITNNHVLPNPDEARGAIAQFNYQHTIRGLSAQLEELAFDPDSFFRTSVEDDWTAVRVQGQPTSRWGALTLRSHNVFVGDHVNIVQHPGGGHKQVSLLSNVVVYVGEGRLQYLTDTLPGSSGSPVFDRDWNVVAVHHSGGWLTEPGDAKKRTYYRNEGTLVDRIMEGIAGNVAEG